MILLFHDQQLHVSHLNLEFGSVEFHLKKGARRNERRSSQEKPSGSIFGRQATPLSISEWQWTPLSISLGVLGVVQVPSKKTWPLSGLEGWLEAATEGRVWRRGWLARERHRPRAWWLVVGSVVHGTVGEEYIGRLKKASVCSFYI